ncbi:Glycosyltransferase involved in cell wall bisynthesis [Carboxydocella thermautotrophica]|nr:Glycosyltransferase involved in cell wall bisynthesis [Carboxydocella thermautotrophica]
MSKNVIFISTNFSPETCPGAKRIKFFAEEINKKNNVIIITLLPNYPQGEIYKNYRTTKVITKYLENNMTVYRIYPLIVPKNRIFLRVLAELYFAFISFLLILSFSKVDLVVTTTPSMFLGPTGFVASKLKRAFFIWDIRDLIWLYAADIIKKRFTAKLIEKLIIKIAHRANGIITTTDSQKEYFIDNGCSHNKILVIPNGVDDDFYSFFCNQIQIDDTFMPQEYKVVYSGLIGYPQDLSVLVETAKLMQNDKRIKFIIAGQGVEYKKIKNLILSNQLRNIELLGYLDQEKIKKLYRDAHILFAHLRDDQSLRTAQPSKIWEYMAVGKPIIFAGEGESKKVLNEVRCGIVVPPNKPEQIVKAIYEIIENYPQYYLEFKSKAHKYISKNRLNSILAKKFENYVMNKIGLKD